MNVRLICNDNSKDLVMMLLAKYHVGLSETSSIWLIDDRYDKDTVLIETQSMPLDVIKLYYNLNALDTLEVILGGIGHLTISDKVIAQSDDKMIIIKLSDVLFFEANSGHVYCHTKDDAFLMKERLYEIEANLTGTHFIRINKSTVVSVDKISEIIPWFNRRLLIKFERSDKQCEVSKNYIQSFKQFLGIGR